MMFQLQLLSDEASTGEMSTQLEAAVVNKIAPQLEGRFLLARTWCIRFSLSPQPPSTWAPVQRGNVFLPVVSACFTKQSRARRMDYYHHLANVAHALPLCTIPAGFSQQQVEKTHNYGKKMYKAQHDGNI